MLRKVLGCCLTGVLVSVAGTALLLWSLTRTAGTEPPAAPPTPAEVQRARTTLDRLRRDLDPPRKPSPAARAIRPSRPRTRTLRVTEADANAMLHALPEVRRALAAARIDRLGVRFENRRVTVTGRVPLPKGLSARVALAGSVWEERGRLVYRTEGVWLGDFPAPAALREEADQQVAALFDDLNRRIQGRVDDLVIEEGSLALALRETAPAR